MSRSPSGPRGGDWSSWPHAGSTVLDLRNLHALLDGATLHTLQRRRGGGLISGRIDRGRSSRFDSSAVASPTCYSISGANRMGAAPQRQAGARRKVSRARKPAARSSSSWFFINPLDALALAPFFGRLLHPHMKPVADFEPSLFLGALDLRRREKQFVVGLCQTLASWSEFHEIFFVPHRSLGGKRPHENWSRPSRWCNFGCGRGPSSGGFGGDV